MLALPIGVGTDSYILHQAMAATEGAAVDGDREMERTVRRIDCTAIAEGLFGDPQQFGEEKFSYNYTAINKKPKNKISSQTNKISNSNSQRLNLNENMNQNNKKQKKPIRKNKKQINTRKSDNYKMISYTQIEYNSDINSNLNKKRPNLEKIFQNQDVEKSSYISTKTYSQSHAKDKYQSSTLKSQSFFGSFNSSKNSKSSSKINKNQLNDFNIDKLIEIGDKYVNLGKPVLPLGNIMNNNILYNYYRIKSKKNKIPINYNSINNITNKKFQFDNISNMNDDVQVDRGNAFKEKKRVSKKIISKNALKNPIYLNDDNKNKPDNVYENKSVKKNFNCNTEIKDVKNVKIKKNSIKKFSKEKTYDYKIDDNNNNDYKNQNIQEMPHKKVYQKKSNLNKKENNNNNVIFTQKSYNNLEVNIRDEIMFNKKDIYIDDASNYQNSNLFNKKKINQNKEFSNIDNKKNNQREKIQPKLYYKDTKQKNYYGYDERHNLEDTIDNHAYFESVHSKKI